MNTRLAPCKYRLRKLAINALKSLLELVNTSACIDKLLLAGEEGVALGTDFNSDLAALSGLGCNSLAACATDYALFVLGMNSGLHDFNTSFLIFRCSLTSFANIEDYITYIHEMQEVFENIFKFF